MNPLFRRTGLERSGLLVILLLCAGPCLGDSFADSHRFSAEWLETPTYASDLGYSIWTFRSVFDDETIDLANTRRGGYQWYLNDLFGAVPNPDSLSFGKDGSAVLVGDDRTPGAQILSASSFGGGDFKGTVFSDGGYFEAVLSFDPEDVIASDFRGWPAFWALGIDSVFPVGGLSNDRWPRQKGNYRHSVEVDVMEFLHRKSVVRGTDVKYGVALHDWHGIWNKTCERLCKVQFPIQTTPTPEGTNFLEPHAYGFLWVPATENSMGYAEFYFDRKLIGRSVAWTKWRPDVYNPPPRGDWVYSKLDSQKLVLILTTGFEQPMKMWAVNVWQRSVEHVETRP